MLSWHLAKNYLQLRKTEVFTSIAAYFAFIAITLSVATLIVVSSVMAGFEKELINKIFDFNGHLSINKIPYPAKDGLTRGFSSQELTNIKQVLAKYPLKKVTVLLDKQAIAINKNHTVAVKVLGEEEYKDHDNEYDNSTGASSLLSSTLQISESKLRLEDNNSHIPTTETSIKTSPTLLPSSSSATIILGKNLAMNLGVGLGEEITLLLPQLQETMFGVIPRITTYPVAKLFDAGMSVYNSSYLKMALQEAMQLFDMTGPNLVELHVEDPLNIWELHKQLLQEPLLQDYIIGNWQQLNANFLSAIRTESNVMFLILLLLVIMSSFNIISSMMVMVKAKAKEIAILKNMGARKGFILRVILLVGLSIGVTSVILGGALGLCICYNLEGIKSCLEFFSNRNLFNEEIKYITQLPCVIDAKNIAFIMISTLFICLLSALYPAYRACLLNPIDVLKAD